MCHRCTRTSRRASCACEASCPGAARGKQQEGRRQVEASAALCTLGGIMTSWGSVSSYLEKLKRYTTKSAQSQIMFFEYMIFSQNVYFEQSRSSLHNNVSLFPRRSCRYWGYCYCPIPPLGHLKQLLSAFPHKLVDHPPGGNAHVLHPLLVELGPAVASHHNNE